MLLKNANITVVCARRSLSPLLVLLFPLAAWGISAFVMWPILAVSAFCWVGKNAVIETRFFVFAIILAGMSSNFAHAFVGVGASSMNSICRNSGGCSALEVIGFVILFAIMGKIMLFCVLALIDRKEKLIKFLAPFSNIAMLIVAIIVIVAIFN